MSIRIPLIALLLLTAGPASAECVYKNVYNHLTDEYETAPFSCQPVKASQTPKFRNWHECPVHEERDAATGNIQRVRSCA
jgi:hypothetical protein